MVLLVESQCFSRTKQGKSIHNTALVRLNIGPTCDALNFFKPSHPWKTRHVPQLQRKDISQTTRDLSSRHLATFRRPFVDGRGSITTTTRLVRIDIYLIPRISNRSLDC